MWKQTCRSYFRKKTKISPFATWPKSTGLLQTVTHLTLNAKIRKYSSKWNIMYQQRWSKVLPGEQLAIYILFFKKHVWNHKPEVKYPSYWKLTVIPKIITRPVLVCVGNRSTIFNGCQWFSSEFEKVSVGSSLWGMRLQWKVVENRTKGEACPGM